MKVRRLVALCTAMFLSLQMAELPASAAGRFSDVPAGSPFYESVTYLAECGITAGTGGHSFSRSVPSQSGSGLPCCSGLSMEVPCPAIPPKERSELSIQRCYQNGWLGVSAAISPDGTLCRGELLLSAFHAAGLPVYNASLYGYEEAGCLRRKTRYALERNLDCAPKRPHHLECSCFRLSIEKSFNRRSMEEKRQQDAPYEQYYGTSP